MATHVGGSGRSNLVALQGMGQVAEALTSTFGPEKVGEADFLSILERSTIFYDDLKSPTGLNNNNGKVLLLEFGISPSRVGVGSSTRCSISTVVSKVPTGTFELEGKV